MTSIYTGDTPLSAEGGYSNPFELNPFYGYGDDLNALQGYDTPATGGVLSPYAAAYDPLVKADDTSQGKGTLTSTQAGYSGPVTPAQTVARQRYDTMYGAAPISGPAPFIGNPLTQGQAAAANTATTTTTTTPTPVTGFTGTDPFIQNTLSLAQSKGMAAGGLAELANKVQDSGRGQDTQLVHMTPKEVKGLQALAQAHGGSLTINPTTGLPEAGFLSDILPTVVGAGVGIATGNPMLGAAVGGGLGMAMSGGNVQRGITSGMGAYGFGSLGAGIAGTGVGALGSTAGTAAMAETIPGVPNMDIAAQALKEGTITASQYEAIAQQYSNAYANAANNAGVMDKLRSGFGATKFNGDFFSNNAIPLGAAGLGLLSSIGSGSSSGQGPATGGSGYIRPYTYAQTRNPLFGQPGQPYFIQKYTAQPVVSAPQWGAQSLPTTTMAGGGLASLNENSMYPMATIKDRTQYATPTQMPVSAEVVAAGYEPATKPYSGEIRFADGGYLGGDTPHPPGTVWSETQGKWVQPGPNSGAMPSPLGSPLPVPTTGFFAGGNANFNPAAIGPMGAGLGGLGRAATSLLGPKTTPDINGLYQYYLGRQPNKDEVGQWANTINGPVTPDMANYFQQFTGAELANSGYKPKGPNPFAPRIPVEAPMQYDPNAYSGGREGGLMPSDLGSYSDGGRLLKGPGDGVSDSIPATIKGKQPARLADGEFVIPARVVSEIGNGSTDAGARKLYAMMDRVQNKRITTAKKGNVAMDSKAEKVLPA